MKIHKTIVVGAGAAGLGCARTLYETDPNHDFLVITKDIGGRIHKTKNDQIYDAALFALSHYKKVRAIVELGRFANPLKVRFFDKNLKSYTVLSLYKNPIQLYRFIKLLRKFNKQYLAYKKRAEVVGQKKALEEYPELLFYYSQSSKDFVEGSNFKTIIEKYIEYVLYSFALEPLTYISTFDVLRYSLVALGPTHEILFDEKRAINGFEDKVIRDEVVYCSKVKDGYKIATKTGKELYSHNLVVATEPIVTKKLLNIPTIRAGTYMHVFTVKGNLKPLYQDNGIYQIYPVGSKIVATVRQKNDKYIVASKSEDPGFERIFSNYKVITDKYWRPSFTIKVDKTLLEADLGDGLYMIGDYNLGGIEDSYITGIYAANKILN